MLALHPQNLLVLQDSHRTAQLQSGLVRLDHRVDVTALGRHIGRGHIAVVALDELTPDLLDLGRLGSGNRLTISCAAPSAPMTAIRAVGHRKLKSAVSCLDPITA